MHHYCIKIFSHLISSNSNRHSPLKPSLLRAVRVREQNTKSGTAITTGEGGSAVPRTKGIGGVGSACVFRCVYIRVYVYDYDYDYDYDYVCVCVYVYVCVHVCVFIFMCVCVFMFMCVDVCVCVFVLEVKDG